MIVAQAYAKINWALDILAVRENGYHEMDMLMQSISVHDTLTFEAAKEVELLTDGSPDPYGEANLIVRAARLLQAECGCAQGVRMNLTKRTPVRAGLGGGSADCAAALMALRRLWRLDVSDERLFRMGFSLGADVAFCLVGGLVRARGLGELLTPLDAPESPELVVLMPDGGLSTGGVFSAYDCARRTLPPVEMDKAQAALTGGDYRALDGCAGNVLTGPAMAQSPAIAPALEALRAQGAVMARMSGSGSAVFGVFEDAETADRARQALSASYDFCERARSSREGVRIEE